jgi:hypothetical protein
MNLQDSSSFENSTSQTIYTYQYNTTYQPLTRCQTAYAELFYDKIIILIKNTPQPLIAFYVYVYVIQNSISSIMQSQILNFKIISHFRLVDWFMKKKVKVISRLELLFLHVCLLSCEEWRRGCTSDARTIFT